MMHFAHHLTTKGEIYKQLNLYDLTKIQHIVEEILDSTNQLLETCLGEVIAR